MRVNFRKLKKQIEPKDGGYMFSPVKGQDELFGIFKKGSKRSFMRCMVWMIEDDREFNREFAL